MKLNIVKVVLNFKNGLYRSIVRGPSRGPKWETLATQKLQNHRMALFKKKTFGRFLLFSATDAQQFLRLHRLSISYAYRENRA